MTTFGVITNNRYAVFQSNVIQGIEEVAAQHGYNVMVDSIAEDPTNPRPMSPEMLQLDGLIVIANILSDSDLRTLYQAGKPLSLISHQVVDTPIPAVIANNRQGMEILMHHMVVECGRRNLVFIRGHMQQNDGIERDEAFQRELLRYTLDVPADFILEGAFVPEQAGEAMSHLLKQRRDFDGVIAADYLMALNAMDVLRQAGLRVPQDVMVAGFGDGVEAEAPGLTTVAADIVEQGRRGARQLIGQMRGLPMRGVTILNTHLIVRRTTQTLEPSVVH
jgi:DNA-binding LacI/PurR family transcriptional regulator